jgi:transposase
LVDEGQSVPQVAATFGVHETTIYRCLSAATASAWTDPVHHGETDR